MGPANDDGLSMSTLSASDDLKVLEFVWYGLRLRCVRDVQTQLTTRTRKVKGTVMTQKSHRLSAVTILVLLAL